MNHYLDQDHESDASYSIAYRAKMGGAPGAKHVREEPAARRVRKAPVQFNGIHRRRRKKFAW